jgi:CO/xanthine dehydrogenase Mo-binding subunit
MVSQQTAQVQEMAETETFSVVGKKVAKAGALEAVLAKPTYTADIASGDPLYVRAVRSPYVHASIKAIDASRAENYPGVVAVLTSKDLPGTNDAGSLLSDRPLLAVNEVRHYGEAVALVIANTREAADSAMSLVRFDCAPLPAVTNPIDALKPDAPKVHDTGNLVKHMKIRKGDVEKGFKESDLIVENTFKTEFIDGLPLETEAAFSYLESDGRITCVCSMQSPFDVHAKVAKILAVPKEKLRMIQATTGGGFGPKSDETPIDVAAYASLTVLKTGKSALAQFTRDESMIIQCKRHPFLIKNKTGVNKDGKLVVWESELIEDTGAYISKGHLVIGRATFHCTGPYEVPNVKADGYCVLTNNTIAGSTRGFGAPQAHFAAEVQMDIIANKLGMDPVVLRAKNILRPGSLTATSQKIEDPGLQISLEKAVEASDWYRRRQEYERCNKSNDRVKKGIGMALLYHGNTLGPEGDDSATVHINITPDGKAIVETGLTDFGTGGTTSLLIVAAEVLGLRYEDVTIQRPDTGRVSNSGPTVASRVTVIGGRAAFDAAQKIKEKLEHIAADLLHCDESMLTFRAGNVYCKTIPNRRISFKDLASECMNRGIQLKAIGYYMAPATKWDEETGQGAPYNQYTFGALVANVEVDTETGFVRVKELTPVYDAGKVINPLALRSVCEGGSIMGIGYGIMEKIVSGEGIIKNPTLHTYWVPTMVDCPEIINNMIVESAGSIGVYGSKSMGEIPAILPAAAIANAVAHAIGVRIREIPITPEKILSALKK